MVSRVVRDIPDGGLMNPESVAAGRNPDAGIVVDVAEFPSPLQQPGALILVNRFRCLATRRPRKLSQRHLPQLQRCSISVVQQRIGFGAV